jgi:hypothetical protein
MKTLIAAAAGRAKYSWWRITAETKRAQTPIIVRRVREVGGKDLRIRVLAAKVRNQSAHYLREIPEENIEAGSKIVPVFYQFSHGRSS